MIKIWLPTSLNRDFSGSGGVKNRFPGPPPAKVEKSGFPRSLVPPGGTKNPVFEYLGGVQKRSKNHQNFGPVPIVTGLAPRRTYYNQLYTGCSTQETQCLLFFQNFRKSLTPFLRNVNFGKFFDTRLILEGPNKVTPPPPGQKVPVPLPHAGFDTKTQRKCKIFFPD